MSPIGLLLLAFGWSAAVWAGATLLCRLRPSPRTAQAIWRAAALLVFVPFAAALVLPGLPSFTAAPLPDLPVLEPLFIQPDTAFVVADTAASVRLPQIGLVLSALVVAGWAVRLALWLASQVRLQRLKARAARVRRPLAHWADAIGLVRVPDIRVIPNGAPFLAGLVRPVVFVPAALINTADAPQVIVHEMVHLKRGDLITRPLERLVADIAWFSPFAWMIRERLDYWREAVVDEAAAGLTGDRIAYARALTRAARLARPVVVLPVAALILPKEGSLKMRLTELLSETPRHPRRLGLAAAALLLLAAPLALAQGMLIKGAAPVSVSSLVYSHPVLDKAKLTSSFGSRIHPITGEMKYHNGVDLAEEEGKPVYAPASGTVTRAEYNDGYGNLVEIVSGETTLRFGQLQEMKVATGDTVVPGQTIATLGQTGKATGPHLHLEVWRAGVPVDPQTEKGLVLAEALRLTAPLAPPAPASAPKAAAAPAPAPASAPTAIPAAVPAAPPPPAPPPMACDTAAEELKTLPRPEGWTARLEAARAENAAAGLGSDAYVPKAITWPKPIYPVEGADQKISASCEVMFDLGTDGRPKNMVSHCTSPYFDVSASSLPGATFEPAKDASGAPVEVKGVIYPLQYCIE
jgi:murein DD-endopeptidase MepM/ murein hydrolase activator NlpD